MLSRVIVMCAALAWPVTVFADTLHLSNGRSISGIVKRQDDKEIELEVSGGSVTFRRAEIVSVEESGPDQRQRMRDSWETQRQLAYERFLESEQKRETESRQSVRLVEETDAIIVPAAINNNNDQLDLMLDTGSSVVMLQPSAAKRLGIDAARGGQEVEVTNADGRRAKAYFVLLERVSAAGAEAFNVDAVVLADEVKDARMGDGLLGMSFLKHFNFKIDRREHKLLLEKL